MDNSNNLKNSFIRRIIFFIIFLIIADLLAYSYVKPIDYTEFNNNYRLPEDRELTYLPFYLEYIKSIKTPKIIVLGSSPTYGTHVKYSKNTYPYTYKNNLNLPVNVYNVSAKGFLLADIYFLVKYLLDYSEIYIIQLNYHTFNHDFIKNNPIRYQDLPKRIGVPVSYTEGALVGLRNTPELALNYKLEEFISNYWFFYREKDRIAEKLLGTSSKRFFYSLYEKYILNLPLHTEHIDYTPFNELSPQKQSILVKRYVNLLTFNINVNENIEFIFLKKIISLLKQKNKKAIFFISPINIEALNEYGLFNWKDYKRNTDIVKDEIVSNNFIFYDFNILEPMQSKYFFDITHTVDSGGIYFGKILAKYTQKYIEKSLDL